MSLEYLNVATLYTTLHGVIFQKTVILKHTPVITSNIENKAKEEYKICAPTGKDRKWRSMSTVPFLLRVA
jgi:hypothetical protein